MRIVVLVLLLLISLACSENAKSPNPPDPPPPGIESMKAKQEAEALMNAGLPFAEKMLLKHGEFFPFASGMTENDEIRPVAVYEGVEHPESANVRASLIKTLRQSALNNEFKAIAIFSDVRVLPPSSKGKTDAVQVELEHRHQYSATVFFPYVRTNGELKFGEVFASARDNVVFMEQKR